MDQSEYYGPVNLWLMFMNLEEAMDQLRDIIQAIETDPSYGYGQFRSHMAHAYHHMNYAWNVQLATAEEIDSEESFEKFSKFPIDEFDQFRG